MTAKPSKPSKPSKPPARPPAFSEQMNVRLTKADMRKLDRLVSRERKADKNYPRQHTRAFWARVLIIRGLSDMAGAYAELDDARA